MSSIVVNISFNPRSRAGSDAESANARSRIVLFQSTLPRGERLPRGIVRSIRYGVSIHAPARGATTSAWRSTSAADGFNPRSRAGSDVDVPQLAASRWFQSTLPRGERRQTLRTDAAHGSGFNPRSRAGSDRLAVDQAIRGIRFQSTLPRGERHCKHALMHFAWQVSIHAPARGATAWHRQLVAQRRMFQSTLPRGERPVKTLDMPHRMTVSIHAPARGAT